MVLEEGLPPPAGPTVPGRSPDVPEVQMAPNFRMRNHSMRSLQPLSRFVSVPGMLLVVLVASLVAYQVYAVAGPGRATAVVTVDLQRVLDGLNQRAKAQVELDAMREETISEDENRQATLKTLKAELDAAPDAEKDAKRESMAMAALDYNAWRAFALERIDIEKSIMLRNLYRSIDTAIDKLAEANGYDIVLSNDSDAELMINSEAQVPREMQIRQQILGKKVLYRSNLVDITDELIERMNNAFNVGG